MANEVGVQREVYRDQFGVLLEDRQRKSLELEWLDSTTNMTEQDFKNWLSRFAREAEARRPSYLLIDVRHFGHRPGDDFGTWRDEQIIPHYNRAGVTKFAMLVPAGVSGWMAPWEGTRGRTARDVSYRILLRASGDQRLVCRKLRS